MGLRAEWLWAAEAVAETRNPAASLGKAEKVPTPPGATVSKTVTHAALSRLRPGRMTQTATEDVSMAHTWPTGLLLDRRRATRGRHVRARAAATHPVP